MRRGGFTLVEAAVALAVAGLAFAGAMSLYTESLRLTQRVSTQTQGSQDAAIGLQYVLANAREALQFSLPGDPSALNGLAFTHPTGGSLSDFQAQCQVNGATVTVNTAVELRMPAAGTAAATFNVLDSRGNVYTDKTVPPAPTGYDRNSVGDLVWIYRGDPLPPGTSGPSVGGAPDPLGGPYLWARRRPAGAADATQDTFQPLCRFVLTRHADGTAACDAVQFVDKATAGTDITSPYEMEVKIVSGDVTLLKGTQTNEATDGTSVNQLFGKCALMRNYNPKAGH